MSRREEARAVVLDQIDNALKKPGCEGWRLKAALRDARKFIEAGRDVLTNEETPG
jgi:hypothetical protein